MKLINILKEITIDSGKPVVGKIYRIKHQYHDRNDNIVPGSYFENHYVVYNGIKKFDGKKYYNFRSTGDGVDGNLRYKNFDENRLVDFWDKEKNWLKKID